MRRARSIRISSSRAALPGRADPARAPQFRLRQLARACAVGARRLRLPRVDRAVVRRHLLQQLLQERTPPDGARGAEVDALFGAVKRPGFRSRDLERPTVAAPDGSLGFRFRSSNAAQARLLHRLDDIGLRCSTPTRFARSRRSGCGRAMAAMSSPSCRRRASARRSSRRRCACSMHCDAEGLPIATTTAADRWRGYAPRASRCRRDARAGARGPRRVLGAVGGPQYTGCRASCGRQQGISRHPQGAGLVRELRRRCSTRNSRAHRR